MPFIVLIPCIACLAVLFRAGTRRAFLTVVLPVLLLLPTDFYLEIKHLPYLSFIDATFLALGIGMIYMDLPRWRFSIMDGFVLLFMFTTTHAQLTPWGLNGAFLRFLSLIMNCLLPYMAGKLLVEQPGMRMETIQRLVAWMAIASLLSMPEFFIKANPHIHLWSHFFPGQFPELPQIRRGFGRVGGPYGGSEQMGMVLMFGLPLAIWLQRCVPPQDKGRGIGYLGRLMKRPSVAVLILGAAMLMAQARGPWIGCIIALITASIGRARRPARRAALILTIILLVGVPLYPAARDYVNAPGAEIGSERQTAEYRALLIVNYVPFAKLGGAWGWGVVLPVIGGEPSIDNDFLLVWLTQGYVGLTALILLFVGGIASLLRLAMTTRVFGERYLIYSLLGILIGLAVCLGTVWLSAQTYELLLFVLGWSQAIRPAQVTKRLYETERFSDKVTQPDLVTVYT